MVALSRAKISSIYARDKGICQICHSPTGNGDWNIDHIVPRSCGGTNWASNLRLTHYQCNWERGDEFTNKQQNAMLGVQYDKQEGRCYLCQDSMSFGAANKIPLDYRLRLSWDNFALVHKVCRTGYYANVVNPWNDKMKKIKGSCIRKIIGAEK